MNMLDSSKICISSKEQIVCERISKPEITDDLPPLSHMHKARDLCLFYRYSNGDCSQKVVNLFTFPVILGLPNSLPSCVFGIKATE